MEYQARVKKEKEMIPTKGDEPYALLKNVITLAEREQVREFFHAKKQVHMAEHIVSGSDYDVAVINQRIVLPELEARLEAIFPTMMVYRTVYLSGRVKNGQYSGWHTDYNGTKSFHGRPVAWNLWIPLQDLNKETGGQLWFYNGPHMPEIEAVLRLSRRKSMLFQYILLDLLGDELEKNKTALDVTFGDGLIFSEIAPHKVDNDFIPTEGTEAREILTLWMIEKDAVLDNEFIQEVIDFPEDGVINQVETKEHIRGLERFCTHTRDLFNESKNILEERKKNSSQDQS